jgi:thioredoxin reductase
MSDRTSPAPKVTGRVDRVFPTLTPAQMARVAAHGRTRAVRHGEVLIEPGDVRCLSSSSRPPGIFAVGDVRGGNVKRVATAVGEGSLAVSFVHQALAE